MRFRLILIGVLLSAACSPASQPPASSAPASAASAATEVVGRAPVGAIVALEPQGGAPMPEGSAVMDQFSKAFVPETLFVRVGQPVIFKNSEDQLHNVTVVRARTGSGVFNISQNQGDVHTHTFDQPGEYDVTCDVHPGMRGTIVATSTPHAMYADPKGTFAFVNVPPGQYTLRVLAEGQEFVRAVEVTGARVDVGDVRRRTAS
jgi:plastocyanin